MYKVCGRLDIMLRYAFENGIDIDFLRAVLMSSWKDQNQVILLYHISSQKRHKKEKGRIKKNGNPFAKIQP